MELGKHDVVLAWRWHIARIVLFLRTSLVADESLKETCDKGPWVEGWDGTHYIRAPTYIHTAWNRRYTGRQTFWEGRPPDISEIL